MEYPYVLARISPVVKAIGKLGGVLQTVEAVGGGVTPTMVRYWLKRDYVPPDKVGELSRCSGVPVEEFARHEMNKYLAKAVERPGA